VVMMVEIGPGDVADLCPRLVVVEEDLTVRRGVTQAGLTSHKTHKSNRNHNAPKSSPVAAPNARKRNDCFQVARKPRAVNKEMMIMRISRYPSTGTVQREPTAK
jgi:hypothetical protein